MKSYMFRQVRCIQIIDEVLNFCTNYHSNLVESQDQNYSSMMLFIILPSKLLTEDYRNTAYQPFPQILNETDWKFLGQIFQEQMKALLTNVPLGYEENPCLCWRDYFDKFYFDKFYFILLFCVSLCLLA